MPGSASKALQGAKPEENGNPLDRFAEGCGGRFGDAVADVRHLLEIGAADGVVLGHRAVVGGRGKAARPGHDADDRLFLGLEEILRVRFERVELLLRDRSRGIGAIAGLCGWRSENALRTAFRKRHRCSMRAWRVSRERPVVGP